VGRGVLQSCKKGVVEVVNYLRNLPAGRHVGQPVGPNGVQQRVQADYVTILGTFHMHCRTAVSYPTTTMNTSPQHSVYQGMTKRGWVELAVSYSLVTPVPTHLVPACRTATGAGGLCTHLSVRCSN
jgi:hypothetical protein